MAVIPTVAAGRFSEILVETPAEIVNVGITGGIRDFGERPFAGEQQPPGPVHPDLVQ